MAPKRKPEPVMTAFKLQPLYHKELIDFLQDLKLAAKIDPSKMDLSEFIRICLYIGKDHPELVKQYKNSPPPPPQISIDELITA